MLLGGGCGAWGSEDPRGQEVDLGDYVTDHEAFYPGSELASEALVGMVLLEFRDVTGLCPATTDSP